jgi:hypothetical protein
MESHAARGFFWGLEKELFWIRPLQTYAEPPSVSGPVRSDGSAQRNKRAHQAKTNASSEIIVFDIIMTSKAKLMPYKFYLLFTAP